MQRGIDIYIGSTRLDTYGSSTVEMNMGGFEVLSIENRTVSYTNSFSLPATPVNMQALGMYGISGVYKPIPISVIIRKGLFQKRALLSVVGADSSGGLQITINYDPFNLIGKLQNTKYYDLPWVESKGTLDLLGLFDAGADSQVLCEALTSITTDRTGFFMPHDNAIIPPVTGTHSDLVGGFVTVASFFKAIEEETDCTIVSTVDFSDMAISNRHIRFYFDPTDYTIDGGFYKYPLKSVFHVVGVSNSPSCADVLKSLCSIRSADFSITDKTIYIYPIAVPTDSAATITPIRWSKQAFTAYGLTNYIQYKDAGITNSKIFTSDGAGENVALEINAVAPEVSVDGMVVPSTDDILIVRIDEWTGTAQYGAISDPVTISAYEPVTWPINNEYSIMQIVDEPVIIDCDCIITPLQSESIRIKRRVQSIELQGDYWVESMAFDFSTGKTKLTLIKI